MGVAIAISHAANSISCSIHTFHKGREFNV